jgi:iron complex transport system substrate-binding protein
MACALGLDDRLVGITHECDYPPEIRDRPIVVRSAIPIEHMTQREIDRAVAERLRTGQSLYQIDENLLRQIAPDMILTQDLCQVCAPSGNEVAQLLGALPNRPQILWQTPKCIEEIFDSLQELGAATGCSQRAEELIATSRARLENVAAMTRRIAVRPRVFCMEWVDPVFCSGHWVPEMVALAGGRDDLGRERADSIRISWQDVVQWAPDVLIVMPCGMDADKTASQAQQLFAYPNWPDIPAVRNNRVYAVDANSYFARPGPRVVDGVELLAHLLYPNLFEWKGSPKAFRKMALPFHSKRMSTHVGADA